MKIFILLSLLSVSAFAQTENKLFQFEAGKYTIECVGMVLNKTEGNDIRRVSYSSEGQMTVVIQGDTQIQYTQMEDEYSTSNTVTKSTTTDLGNGLYKQAVELSDTSSYPNQTESTQYKYEVDLKVTNNVVQNILIRKENEAEKPGFGEWSWIKMNDGRIVVQNYIREKHTHTTADGKKIERFVGNETCTFTPVKK